MIALQKLGFRMHLICIVLKTIYAGFWSVKLFVSCAPSPLISSKMNLLHVRCIPGLGKEYDA